MDCFQYMKDIYFESFEQFTNEVDIARNNMLKVDTDEIRKDPIRIDLNTAKELPDGRLNIQYEETNFECFFHYRETKVLYVFLNGAITGKGATVPMFARWSYYKFMGGSALNISDPMYRMYDKLKLGWYYGTEKLDLQQRTADLVVKIADLIEVKKSNIIFVGSSGGGYASIACASRISGAKSIAINPQIVLREWVPYSAEFTKITGISLSHDDKQHRNNLIYFLQNCVNNRYLLFVNIRSKLDMHQVGNICHVMDKRVKYGLNIFDNVAIWIYDADLTPWLDYHDVQENYSLCFLFEFIMNSPWKKLEQLSSFFRLINEFYYDMRKNEKYWRGKIPDIERLMQIWAINRKIAIFGSGKCAEQLNEELFGIEKQNYYHIQYIIDNDVQKQGSMYHGIPIIHPSKIDNWTDFYIIITSSRFHESIRQQLEKKRLTYEKDFIIYKDLYQ